jgi:hypothetical protein
MAVDTEEARNSLDSSLEERLEQRRGLEEPVNRRGRGQKFAARVAPVQSFTARVTRMWMMCAPATSSTVIRRFRASVETDSEEESDDDMLLPSKAAEDVYPDGCFVVAVYDRVANFGDFSPKSTKWGIF